MADATVGPRHAEALCGPEDLLVELDGVRGAVDGQVRGDPRVAVGDGLHCRHVALLLAVVFGTGILPHKTGHVLTG